MFTKNLNVSLLLDFYGDILTDRQRETLDLYYNDDLSLAEIAENVGLSRQGVRFAIKKGENILIDMENKLGLAARFQKMQNEISRIAESMKQISSSDKESSEKINSIVSDIDDLLKI